jgi:hypothetical protein
MAMCIDRVWWKNDRVSVKLVVMVMICPAQGHSMMAGVVLH